MLMATDMLSFQFHKGSIKTFTRFALRRAHPHFNSIKVRLRRISTPAVGQLLVFQFHKGSIKTLNGLAARRRYLNFNSIKVRLRPCHLQIPAALIPFQFHKGSIKTDVPLPALHQGVRFQFHKGSIKTVEFNIIISFKYYFNSIKVRLRLKVQRIDGLGDVHFNSIKVRLRRPLPLHLSRLAPFQFHKGSIKTCKLQGLSCLYRISIP